MGTSWGTGNSGSNRSRRNRTIRSHSFRSRTTRGIRSSNSRTIRNRCFRGNCIHDSRTNGWGRTIRSRSFRSRTIHRAASGANRTCYAMGKAARGSMYRTSTRRRRPSRCCRCDRSNRALGSRCILRRSHLRSRTMRLLRRRSKQPGWRYL
jgi:hypothetical protein